MLFVQIFRYIARVAILVAEVSRLQKIKKTVHLEMDFKDLY